MEAKLQHKESKWIPLAEAAEHSPYSAEYLSLLARKGRLTAKKINGVWHTTLKVLVDYLRQQSERAKVLNKNTDTYRPFLTNVSSSVTQQDGIENLVSTAVSQELHSTKQTESPEPVFEEFMRKFNAHIDTQVEKQHGAFFKVTRFIRRSYTTVFSSKKLCLIFSILLILTLLLPFRFVSGFAEAFYRNTIEAVRDAQTVMGFRPGTHENEILLLGQKGEISIFGNVETEGQFRSYVEDGIAPMVVSSRTQVGNLNADYVDNLSSKDFTLAFVTKNGNVTYESVRLEGDVEIGSTLLVHGATKLLQHLTVDGIFL